MLAFGVCQTACNAAAVACYTAAGLVFGAVTLGAGAPAAAVACSATQGACMTACAWGSVAKALVWTTSLFGVGGSVWTYLGWRKEPSAWERLTNGFYRRHEPTWFEVVMDNWWYIMLGTCVIVAVLVFGNAKEMEERDAPNDSCKEKLK